MQNTHTDGKMLEVIEGTVESIIYTNTDNGYTVFDMSSDPPTLLTPRSWSTATTV